MLRALEKSLKKKKSDAAAVETWVLMAAHNEHCQGWILRCAVRCCRLHMLIHADSSFDGANMGYHWISTLNWILWRFAYMPDDVRWQLLWKQFCFNQMFTCHFWQTVGHALRRVLGRHVPAIWGKRVWVELHMWLRGFPNKLCPAFKYVHFCTIDHRYRKASITTCIWYL